MLHLSLIANFLTALNQVERRHRLDSHHLPNITTFLFNFFANLQENLSPRTALESVYPGVFPPMMERFFLCYGDETPGSVKPSGEHGSCFGEVLRNGLHNETCKHGRDSPNITFFNMAILEYYFFVQGCFPRISH